VIRSKPNYKALSVAADEFIDKSEAILQFFKEKYLEKYTSTRLTPYERPMSIFKTKSYDLIRKTINSPGGHLTIKNIHSIFNIDHKGPDYDDNPFYWGLLAMDHDRDHPVLTPQQVGLLARQMYYADRHDVPPCLFVGFLYQAGIAAGISQVESKGRMEPWGKSEMVRAYKPVE
jgi:hypothetical protein